MDGLWEVESEVVGEEVRADAKGMRAGLMGEVVDNLVKPIAMAWSRSVGFALMWAVPPTPRELTLETW